MGSKGVQISHLSRTPYITGAFARGIPTGAYKGSFDNGSTARSSGQDRKRTESLYQGDNIFKIADRVVEVAETYGKTPAADRRGMAVHG